MLFRLVLCLILAPILKVSGAGNESPIVAIIDTGADVSHPDLVAHLWVNPGESGLDSKGRDKATNGIDDDNNGFVDDLNGWNFADNSNRMIDRHGHGTHIAGIIAATAPKARLMILKYFNPTASGEANQRNTIRAIEYATRMKARIINYSAGGTDPSVEEKQAIEKAADHEVLFVAAAGNESSDSDTYGFYPASYRLANIVSVTAIDANQKILKSSNFGRYSVDLAAPGKNILSAKPGGGYATMTGTSQATAFVSGAAAQIMIANGELKTPESVIPYLLQTGKFEQNLAVQTKTGTVVDVVQSLEMKGSDLSAFGQRALNVNQINSQFAPDELPLVASQIRTNPKP